MMRRTVCLLAMALAWQFAPHAAAQTEPNAADAQAKREAALAKMLGGATLEGSFTISGAGHDGARLAREKYTLGDVKKLDGNQWLIPARIQYGGKDVQLPLTFPIEWAGDTPVVVVDNVGLPGFGVVSARVMFFDDHYAGYWHHGEASGNLFGVIHRANESAAVTGNSSE